MRIRLLRDGGQADASVDSCQLAARATGGYSIHKVDPALLHRVPHRVPRGAAAFLLRFAGEDKRRDCRCVNAAGGRV